MQFPGFSSSPFEDRQHNRASQPSCAAAISREEGIALSVSWLFLVLFPLRTPRWMPSGCGDLLHLSFSSYSTTSSLETSFCIKATLWFSLQSAFGTGISTWLSAADMMQGIHLTPLLACCTLLPTHFIQICGDLWGVWCITQYKIYILQQVSLRFQLVFSHCSTERYFCTLLHPLSSHLIWLVY